MITDKIYNEDCNITLTRDEVKYDYVFAVPPDFNEINLDPKRSADIDAYKQFIGNIFSKIKPSKNICTVSLTDRKANRGIVPKHIYIWDVFDKLGYTVISHKIWQKSTKLNLYRLNYSNVITFARGDWSQNKTKDFEYDIWLEEDDKFEGFSYGMSSKVVKRCIERYTVTGDIVYDPFMGSGTTAAAAIECGRHYLGSEIQTGHFDLAVKRLKTSKFFNYGVV